MKKKSLVLLTAMTMAFALTACGGSDKAADGTTAAPAAQEGTQTGSGYSFKSGSTTIAMNVPAADILSALGEPSDKYEAESCAFQGMDRTYTYPGYTVDTYENNGVETILHVTFQDDTVSTPEGLAIGQNVDKAKELYGDAGEDNGSSITYTKDGTKLIVFYENGTISQIQYEAITD